MYLVTDSQCIWLQTPNVFGYRLPMYFGQMEEQFQIFSILEFNCVRQTEMYTTEPLVPEPSTFEFE